eukprot:g2993.t1
MSHSDASAVHDGGILQNPGSVHTAAHLASVDGRPPRSSGRKNGINASKLTDKNSVGKAKSKETNVLKKQSKVKPKLKPTDFILGSLLGEGAYAKVVRVMHEPKGVEYAVKVLEKKFIIREKKQKFVMMERNVLARLSHPNIVRLVYTFQDSRYLFFVMDLCPNGDLLRLIRHCAEQNAIQSVRGRALSLSQTLFYSAEIVVALQYLHSMGVVHRDLKPENLLLDCNGHLKLGDFGTALDQTASGTKRCNTFCGTAEYVSPEVLQDHEATAASDLWALGCIVFQMFTGRPPFKGASEYLTFQMIIDHKGLEVAENKGGTSSPAEAQLQSKLSSASSISNGSPAAVASSPSLSRALSGVSLGSLPSNRMKQPLEIPETVPKQARDFINALLQPNPKSRLGAPLPNAKTSESYEALMIHDFFSNQNSEISENSEKKENATRNFYTILNQDPPSLPWSTPLSPFPDKTGETTTSSPAQRKEPVYTLDEFELSLSRLEMYSSQALSISLDVQEERGLERLSQSSRRPMTPESPWSSATDLITAAAAAEDIIFSEKTKTTSECDGFYSSVLQEGESILLSGPIIKRRYLSTKHRTLLLTNTPRLIYLDPETNFLKGEIPWSNDMEVVVRDKKMFDIITPGRIYKLEDMMSCASRWQTAIYNLLGRNPSIA